MNYIKNILTAMFLLFTAPLMAQSNYALVNNFSLAIQGSSNLHDWAETIGKAGGSSMVTWNSDGSFDLDNLIFTVQAQSITSSEGSVMNDKTYKALKTAHNPVISFVLTAPVKSVQCSANGYAVTASGNLTIAGVTKPVTMHVNVVADEHGKIVFEGAQPIKMSDFGIDPPTALFGMLKVTDNIMIKFKTTFIQKS